MLLMFNRDPDFYDEHGSNWESALDYVAKLNAENYLGYNDWRLPNRNELTSLIDHSKSEPNLPKNHPFVTGEGWYYYGGFWTSTTVADFPEKAWIYYFGNGNLYNYEKTIESNVWAVRTDKSIALPTGSINGVIEGAGLPKEGIEITLEGPINARTEVSADGSYILTGLPEGSYTVRASHLNFTFTPELKTVVISSSSESCDFTASYTGTYGWTDISSNLFPYGNAAGAGLSSIYFINDDEGWVTNASIPEVYHTTDGGETWEVQTTPLGAVSAIHMIDADNGYCGGEGGWIYRTEDGGENWNIVGSMGSTLDISFPPGTDPNDPIGYASGDYGRIWEITSTGLTDLNSSSSSTLSGISASSVNNAWICGGGRIFYYNGADFTSQIAPGGTFNDIHFVNDLQGWVVGNGGVIGHTTDGGAGWIEQTNPDTQNLSLYGVFFLDSDNGLAVGVDGTILHTTDAGATWTIEAAGLTNSFLRGVFFTSAANGYISGNNGILLKYSKLVTDVKEDHQPQKFMLKQNYPNPFNPSTKIQYTIPSTTHPSIPSQEGKERSDRGVSVQLIVYDILGRVVTTLVNKYQPPGSYEVEFNPVSSSKYLATGIYFYQLRFGEFVETKKMLLLK